MKQKAKTAVYTALSAIILCGSDACAHSTGPPSTAGKDRHQGIGSPFDCQATNVRLQPRIINTDGSLSKYPVPGDQPRDSLSVGLPLYPGAAPARRGISPVYNPWPPPAYKNTGVSYFTIETSVIGGIVWYRHALHACGFALDGGPQNQNASDATQLGLFQSPLTPALNVAVKLDRLPGGQSSVVYFASALSTPVRPPGSYVPIDPHTAIVSQYVRTNRAGVPFGYRIPLHRGTASMDLLTGLLNRPNNTAVGGCPGFISTLISQKLEFGSSVGSRWTVEVLPTVCAGSVSISWAPCTSVALGCDAATCGPQTQLLSDAIDTVVRLYCATHGCRIVRLKGQWSF